MNKKAFVLTWTMIAIVGAAATLGLATRFILKMKPDNKVEQMCEKIILNHTGIAVDLSPDTVMESDAMSMDLIKTT